MRLHLEYAHTLDPVAWSAQHAAGLVPDRLPYGLDRLEPHGFELHAKEPGTGIPAVLDGVTRRASGGFEFVEALRSRARRSCDVAVCWDERAGVPAALRSRLPGEPDAVLGVIWLTDPDAPVGRRGRMLAKQALQQAAAIWTMSSPQHVILERDFAVDPRRIHLLHMGIDVDFWLPSDKQPEPDLVLSAGNDRHRDHRLIVEAIARLRRRRPNVRLELVTRAAVDVPAELGKRHPHLSHREMRELYGRSSVVVLALKPNLHLSGLSVMLEAMACARPVVVTDSPGLSDYLRHGETGLVVPAGDADTLDAAVNELLSDPGRAQALGQAGRHFVQAFSTSAQASTLNGIIRGSCR